MLSISRTLSSLSLLSILATGLLLSPPSYAADSVIQKPRIISIGGSVTEIIYRLGQQDQLVARDTTSLFPEAVQQLPDVGYMRRLSPEGVLSVEPDMIIAEAGSGPQETIEVLKAASIDFIEIPDGHDRAAVKAKILAVSEALNLPEKGQKLATEIDRKLAEAEATASVHEGKTKRVLFILSTQGGRIMAAGTNTGADGIIRMAGAINALSEFEGYKPVTDEAIIASAPDVILMMSRSGTEGGNHNKADDELFNMAAIGATPAAKTRNVIRINGSLLLGFGPRTAEAVKVLSEALYSEKTE